MAVELRDLHEEWSTDGLSLTVSALLPDGREAKMTVRWATPELAAAKAPSTRKDMLAYIARHAEQDSPGVRRTVRRLGPLNVVVSRESSWRWLPDLALPTRGRRGVGVRLFRHSVLVAPRDRTASTAPR